MGKKSGYGYQFTNETRYYWNNYEIYNMIDYEFINTSDFAFNFNKEDVYWINYFEGMFENDKKNGYGVTYHRDPVNHAKRSAGNYLNDEKHGFFKNFIGRKGEEALKNAGCYKNGEQDGYYKSYSSITGKLRGISYNSENKESCDIDFLYEGGYKEIKFTYDKLYANFYHNTKIEKRMDWSENGQQFLSVEYKSEGKIKRVGAEYKGEKDGYNIVYDSETGLKTMESFFKSGFLDNRAVVPMNSQFQSKIYYDSGELKFEGIFSRGEKDGNGTEYYKNGNIKTIGYFIEYLNPTNYNEDMLFYDESGKLIEECSYDYGYKHGLQKIYKENGVVEETMYFNNKKFLYDKNDPSKDNNCGCKACKNIRRAIILKDELTKRIHKAKKDRDESNGSYLSIKAIIYDREDIGEELFQQKRIMSPV